MSIKRKITITLFALIAAICFAMPLAANVKTTFADADFAMINGASVRYGNDEGIRFVAKVTDVEKDYHMLIVPYDWVSDCSAGADYYAVASAKAAETSSTLADMECKVVPAGENNGFGLNADDNCVKGSLTGIKYDNINVKWFGIAYYTAESGTRTYASFAEGENVRSIVKVASGCLNKYELEESEENKLLAYVAKGLAKANGTAEEDYVYSKPTFTLDKTSITGTYKDDDQTITVNGLNDAVEICVDWSSSDASSVSVDGNGKTGTISFVGVNSTVFGSVTKTNNPATISAKICGNNISASVTSKTKRLSGTFEVDSKNNYKETVALSTTYGGNTNDKHTTVQMEVKDSILTQYDIDGSDLVYWRNAGSAASVTESGLVKDGVNSGVACIAWRLNDADGDALMWDQVNVRVGYAISTKYDMDMLALAYARGNVGDWAKYYVLVNDIDYEGEVYIPIAANNGRNVDEHINYIGLQWKTILDEDNEYGITYNQFKAKGLNQYNWHNVNNTHSTWEKYCFSGCFDGNGYTISNGQMMFDAMGWLTNSKIAFNSGLFGAIGENGIIKNVSFKNFSRQDYKDAGYTSETMNADNSTVATWSFDAVTTTAETLTVSTITTGVYPDRVNCTTLIGSIRGVIEDVYVQASYMPQVGTGFGASGIQSYIAFSVLNGASAKLTNCYFELEDCIRDNNVFAYRVLSGCSATINNVIIAGLTTERTGSNAGQSTGITSGATVYGSVSMYATTDDLKTALSNGSVTLGSSWTVDSVTGLPVLNIR